MFPSTTPSFAAGEGGREGGKVWVVTGRRWGVFGAHSRYVVDGEKEA